MGHGADKLFSTRCSSQRGVERRVRPASFVPPTPKARTAPGWLLCKQTEAPGHSRTRGERLSQKKLFRSKTRSECDVEITCGTRTIARAAGRKRPLDFQRDPSCLR